MKRVSLAAKTREPGKGACRQMRMVGGIPAVLYGKSVESLAISVNRREVEQIVKGKGGTNVLIDLSIEGGDSGLALIRDFQADPFRREFVHIDFQAITMKDKLEIEVPIELVGKSIGVKEGGVVDQLRRSVNITALPDKIPTCIEVDIAELMIGDSVHADGLKLPEGVEFPYKENYTIVAVVPPAKIEEVAALTAEVAEGEEGAAPAEGEAKEEGAAPAEGKAEKGKE